MHTLPLIIEILVPRSTSLSGISICSGGGGDSDGKVLMMFRTESAQWELSCALNPRREWIDSTRHCKDLLLEPDDDDEDITISSAIT